MFKYIIAVEKLKSPLINQFSQIPMHSLQINLYKLIPRQVRKTIITQV